MGERRQDVSRFSFWLFFTGFVGLNLLQSAFTGWCPMEIFLGKLGVVRVER